MQDTAPAAPPEKPVKLPTLRGDISINFNDYDLEGKPQWVIHDPVRNKFFLIGWLEYEILERWGLANAEQIAESVNNETTLNVDESDIESLANFLKRNYLVIQSGYEIDKMATEQKLFQKEKGYHWLISNYLFFRIPLCNPDQFLKRTRFIGDLVFNQYTTLLMTLLGIVAVYLIGSRWDSFIHTFGQVLTLEGIVLSLIGFIGMKLLHELGHAYMCRRYNIPVITLGIAFMVFWPVLYTDTTSSWRLPSKQRFYISIAGIWIETYLAIIAAFIWFFSSDQTIQTMAYVTIAFNWVASLLINVSPFMRFDGYHILADFLRMPNLQPRAFALTRWQIRHSLFAWKEEAPERFPAKFHWFLIAYSITTWLYRLVLFLGIALLVYHLFAKVIGLILFLIEIYYFILAPIVNEIKFWYQNKEQFNFNFQTKITCTVGAIIFLLFFVPVKSTLSIPATLSYMHMFLYAPQAGILTSSLPAPGARIQKDAPIVAVSSMKIDQALLETKLEYTKKVNQLRRATVSPRFITEKTVLLSDIKKLRSQYDKLIKMQEKLTLRVPFDGYLAEADTLLKAGDYVKENQWLGDVVNPNQVIVEAFVAQKNINAVKEGVHGYFYPLDMERKPVPVTVTAIEVMNVKELDCSYSSVLEQKKEDSIVVETPCYNASELGGGVATQQTVEGKYAPTESIFYIVLKPQIDVQLQQIERGTVHLDIRPMSYAYRFWYWIKTTLVQESEF